MPAKAERETREARIKETQLLFMNQYRSFKSDIVYLHMDLASTGRTFEDLKKDVFHKLPGWNSSSKAIDPMRRFKRAEGDEVPEGSMEVVYLENCFKYGGSALGFQVVVGHEYVDEDESDSEGKGPNGDDSDKENRATSGANIKNISKVDTATKRKGPLKVRVPDDTIVNAGAKRKHDEYNEDEDESEDDEEPQHPIKKPKLSPKDKIRRPKTILYWFFFQGPIAPVLEKLTTSNVSSESSQATLARLLQDALEEAKHPAKRQKKKGEAAASVPAATTTTAPASTSADATNLPTAAPPSSNTITTPTTATEGAERPAKRQKKAKAPITNTTTTATAPTSVATAPSDGLAADNTPTTTATDGTARPAKRQRKSKGKTTASAPDETTTATNTASGSTSTAADKPLFDVVGTLAKGGKGKNGAGETGHPEHMALFESVEETFAEILRFQKVEWIKAADARGIWDGDLDFTDEDEDDAQEDAADGQALDDEQEEEWETVAAPPTAPDTCEREQMGEGEVDEQDEEDEFEDEEAAAEAFARFVSWKTWHMWVHVKQFRREQKRLLAGARARGAPLLPEVEELVANWKPLKEVKIKVEDGAEGDASPVIGKKRKREEYELDEDAEEAVPGPDDILHSIEVPEDVEAVDQNGDTSMSESVDESGDEDEDGEVAEADDSSDEDDGNQNKVPRMSEAAEDSDEDEDDGDRERMYPEDDGDQEGDLEMTDPDEDDE